MRVVNLILISKGKNVVTKKKTRRYLLTYSFARSKFKHPLCIFSSSGCHSLNLVGVDEAASCKEAITFGIVQTVYKLFSCSPTRLEIFTKNIGSSIDILSETRWTADVASVSCAFVCHCIRSRAIAGIESDTQD